MITSIYTNEKLDSLKRKLDTSKKKILILLHAILINWNENLIKFETK